MSLTFFLDFFRGLRIQLLGFLASMLYFFTVHLIDIDSFSEDVPDPYFWGKKPFFGFYSAPRRVKFLRFKIKN